MTKEVATIIVVGIWIYIVSGIILFIRTLDFLASGFDSYKTLPLVPSFNAAIILFNFFIVPALFHRIIVEFKSIMKYARKN